MSPADQNWLSTLWRFQQLIFKKYNNNNCKTSIALKSLTRSSSEAQQTKSTYTGTSKSCHWSKEPPIMYGGKAISNKYVFSFLRKVSIVTEVLIVIGSWFQIVGAATEKARLPIVQLSFRNKKLFGNGWSKGLRYIRDISETCGRLTK